MAISQIDGSRQIKDGTITLVKFDPSVLTSLTSWKSASFSSSTSTDLPSFDLVGKFGKMLFEDSLGGSCTILLLGLNPFIMESGRQDWVLTNSPGSGKVGLSINSTKLNITLGASSSRVIGWSYNGI